jgi:hypothetical protein
VTNPEHDRSLMMAAIYISKYLRVLPREEAMRRISSGYSNKALTSLYETALDEEDYEVCSIVKEILETIN